jgi:hypothetical protein
MISSIGVSAAVVEAILTVGREKSRCRGKEERRVKDMEDLSVLEGRR